MLEKLSNLRSDLEKINDTLFSSFAQRSKIVYAIQSVKNSLGKSIYDKNRELELFKKDSDKLSRLNAKELLIYSLMIESDANKFDGTYPLWSNKVHLDSSCENSIAELTNPSLLALYDKKSYSSLDIKPKFQVDV